MKDLSQYINNLNNIDMHLHSFGRNGIYKSPYTAVHMVDNLLKFEDEPLMPYFKEHFEHDYPYTLIVGCNGEESVKLWNRYHDKIIGFGEVKIFKDYINIDGEHKTFEDWENITTICNLHTGYPIWIHYDLCEDNVLKLDEFFKKYRDHNFVLCHCGMNETFDKDKSYELARDLQIKNDNVWLDVSWVTLDYMDEKKMANLDGNRLLIGTDISKDVEEKDIDKIYKEMFALLKYISPLVNLNKIIVTRYKYKKFLQ